MLKIKSEDITLTSTDFRNNYFTDVNFNNKCKC